MTNKNTLGIYSPTGNCMSPWNNFNHWVILTILVAIVIGYTVS
ncbi:MAG: hypothetical protein V4511_07840 [Bacteroidota bacterium]